MIRFDVWDGDHGWTHDQFTRWPWNGIGWNSSWLWRDWLLGDFKQEILSINVCRVPLEMPEGTYIATVTIQQFVHARRWGRRWVRPMCRGSVEVEAGVPHPGKGTAGHNLGDSASSHTAFAAEKARPSVASLIDQFRDEVLTLREERAGPGWVPTAGWKLPPQPEMR